MHRLVISQDSWHSWSRVGNATFRVGPLSLPADADEIGPAAGDTGVQADPACIDAGREVLLPAAAGSVLFFRSLLLHRSSPNTLAQQRRAILLSFQPAGRPRHEDLPWNPKRVHE